MASMVRSIVLNGRRIDPTTMVLSLTCGVATLGIVSGIVQIVAG